jgi:hypothetical protein
MGFLPWERLPAYVLGPLLCILGTSLWLADDAPSLWNQVLEIGCVAAGIAIACIRYKTGEEPLWTPQQRAEARRKRQSL